MGPERVTGAGWLIEDEDSRERLKGKKKRRVSGGRRGRSGHKEGLAMQDGGEKRGEGGLQRGEGKGNGP